MSKKVFISHSSKDHKVAMAVCTALESRGHSCWMSSRDIMPGENFQGSIVRAIREAGVMVLVFSSNANNSDEIKKEMALASQSRKTVIPVRAEDVTPSEDFTYELATRQWIDMFIDWEVAIEKLSRQVDTWIPRGENARTADSPPPLAKNQPQPAASNSGLLVAGLAVLLLIGGAAAFWLSRQPAPAVASAPPTAVAPQQQAAAPAPAPQDSARLESELWDSVKTSNNPAVVQSYLEKFPNGTFAAVAKARLEELNRPVRTVRVQPSFSCAAAVNRVERAICADPGLSALDAQTAALYKRAAANVTDEGPLASEQSAFVIRRNRCTDAGCIHQSYVERRDEIARWLDTESR